MGDLCFYWDSINKMIILQHNAIKASFQKSLHVVRHRFKVTAYNKFLDFVPKYALNLIAEKCDKVKSVGFDKKKGVDVLMIFRVRVNWLHLVWVAYHLNQYMSCGLD